jgi:hypothetical protein
MLKKTGYWLLILLMGCSLSAFAQKKPRVFVLDADQLAATKRRIASSDAALMPAYKKLLKEADKGLKIAPMSVMEKTMVPPSGDKHDYMSLAPYFWPDPSKPDGLPYIRKDGQTNPEVKEFKDKEYLPRLCDVVYQLSLAWYLSGNNAYAEHAARLLRVWFLDEATRMNPNLNYGQMIRGVNDGRGAGLIDTRHFLKLIDGIGMLGTSSQWKAADQAGMQRWFAGFLNWMQTSKNGLDEMKAQNNHGAWYDAQRLSMALFIDSTRLAREIVENAADRLDKQQDEHGLFPKEMERTISLHYTVFAMDAFFDIAKMSRFTGIDFWNYKTSSGKSLAKGFAAIRPYLEEEKKWEGPQIKPYPNEESFGLLMEGQRFGCKSCRTTVQRLAGDKSDSLLINLLYP